MYKDIDAGLIDQQCVGRTVHIAGWVHRRRDHGKLIFIDLRDRSGLVQVVFDPEISEPAFKIAEDLRSEFVITIAGTVNARPQGTINLNMATGTVEIAVSSIRILNRSKTPPFYINEEVDIDENMRLKYRYLDFRRERMRNNLILRHKVTDYIHKFLDDSGFLEVETPILTKSTPEGARDYLVPARLYPGQFFALPQSPQQMKQLLMVGGIERYYQIARCFRDEDSRSDRQPEFTQLDIEMSFIDENDILKLMHTLLTGLVRKVASSRRFNEDFPVFSYHEA
ncbi:MAG: aspartate--tRNA ligase, partial [Chloroflexi bacterium]|nr:aspartate--tRNA ligase [Chloroflexota bacterium]